jgi:hypothetical protein
LTKEENKVVVPNAIQGMVPKKSLREYLYFDMILLF